jgi:hypothetical protein
MPLLRDDGRWVIAGAVAGPIVPFDLRRLYLGNLRLIGSSIELAASDSSVVQLVADDAAEGIGLKISKNGGLTRCRRQRDVCVSAGLTISVQDTVGSLPSSTWDRRSRESSSVACSRPATWFRRRPLTLTSR